MIAMLTYRSNVGVEDLDVNECTVHRAGNSTGARWWLLWFRVNRETDSLPFDVGVPLNPNGGWVEAGPGGKTWGITKTGSGTWQIAPSINVLNTGAVHAGEYEAPSLWHQTPAIVGVPDGEAWQSEQP